MVVPNKTVDLKYEQNNRIKYQVMDKNNIYRSNKEKQTCKSKDELKETTNQKQLIVKM